MYIFLFLYLFVRRFTCLFMSFISKPHENLSLLLSAACQRHCIACSACHHCLESAFRSHNCLFFPAAISVLGKTEQALLHGLGRGEAVTPGLFVRGSAWVWLVWVIPRPFYRREKRPHYPINRRLNEPHRWSWCLGEGRNASWWELTLWRLTTTVVVVPHR